MPGGSVHAVSVAHRASETSCVVGRTVGRAALVAGLHRMTVARCLVRAGARLAVRRDPWLNPERHLRALRDAVNPLVDGHVMNDARAGQLTLDLADSR